MSTSLIYYAFGGYGYRYLKTEYYKGCVRFHLKKKSKYQVCVVCGSDDVIQGREKREIRTLPIRKRAVFLILHLHRLYCKCVNL